MCEQDIKRFAENYTNSGNSIIDYIRKILLAESSRRHPDYRERLRIELEPFYSKQKLKELVNHFDGFFLSKESSESINKVHFIESFVDALLLFIRK